MKEKFIRFMVGRYGMDAFGKCTVFTGLISVILSSFFDSMILSILAWVLILYSYFRMFSKDVYKRSAENQLFLNKTYKLRCWLTKQKNLFAQKKLYHIYTCPTCSQKIRVPKGKGQIEVCCPKCNATFIKKS